MARTHTEPRARRSPQPVPLAANVKVLPPEGGRRGLFARALLSSSSSSLAMAASVMIERRRAVAFSARDKPKP